MNPDSIPVCRVTLKHFVCAWCGGEVSAMDESEASHLIDMQGCYCEPFKLYYNNGGELLPVTTGPVSRCDSNSGVVYATSEMRAGGRCVGHVEHTDH